MGRPSSKQCAHPRGSSAVGRIPRSSKDEPVGESGLATPLDGATATPKAGPKRSEILWELGRSRVVMSSHAYDRSKCDAPQATQGDTALAKTVFGRSAK